MWTVATDGEAFSGTMQTDGAKVFIKKFYGGIARNGSATVSAIEADSGQEVWQFTAPYWVDSLFLDDGLILFQGYETEPERRETLYVIDPDSGRELWHSSLAGFFSDPLVAKGRVFFVGEDLLYALDATTGEQLWTLPIEEDWFTVNVLADESGLYIWDDAGALYSFDVGDFASFPIL